MNYKNGNTTVTLDDNGTRTLEFEGEMVLDQPLNLDIRVSTSCSFADNICAGFCHESAVRDGKDANWHMLKGVLSQLNPGIELAIGSNRMTDDLTKFIVWCNSMGFVVNVTVNQGHLSRDSKNLMFLINAGHLKGLGISYRSSLTWLKKSVPQFFLDYDNTVFHVIAGIDSIRKVQALREKGVRKVLVLGEKSFGYNSGKVDLDSRSHKEWRWWIPELFTMFEVVSFDNLALEQLEISRLLTKQGWDTFYNGEHSFYINAVDGTFSRSSRQPADCTWHDMTVKQYFQKIEASSAQ